MLGIPIIVINWEGDQVNPRLAYNHLDDQFLVVWEDHPFAAPTGWSIYARRVDSSGGLVDEAFMIASGGETNRSSPDVAFNPAGRSFLVAWELELYPSDHDLYRRRVAYNGTQPEAEGILSMASAQETRLALASSSSSRLLAAWEDYRDQAQQGSDI